MENIESWLIKEEQGEPPVDHKNKQGGFTPEGDQVSIFKKVDLITLPTNVEGTNCFNCEYVKVTDKKQGIGFCTHKKIKQYVTKNMCCAEWDNKGVKRVWK